MSRTEMLILLCIVVCISNSSTCNTNCLQKILPFLAKNPNGFTFFFGYPRELLQYRQISIHLLPDQNFISPYLLISNMAPLYFYRKIPMFSKQVDKNHNIVVMTVPWSNPRTSGYFMARWDIEAFLQLLSPITTTFILVQNVKTVETRGDPMSTAEVLAFPAVTIVLTIPSHCIISKVKSNLVTETNRLVRLYSYQLQDLLESPNRFRRKYFANYFGAIMNSVVFELFGSFVQSSNNHKIDRNKVSKLCYNSAFYAEECTSHLSTVAVLSMTHNFSANVMKSEATVFPRLGITLPFPTAPYIISGMSSENYDDHVSRVIQSQVGFDRFESYILHYCGNKRNGKNILQSGEIWLLPLKWNVWVTLLLIMPTVIILQLYCKRQLEKTPKLILFSIIAKSCNWFIIFIALFICWFYENDLLSMVTVIESMHQFESLEEFLNAGYKIKSYRTIATDQTEELLKFDFEILGLGHRINQSFFTIPNATNVMTGYIAKPYFMAKYINGEKASIMYDSSVGEIASKFLQSELVNTISDASIECLTVKQELYPRFQHWKFNTAGCEFLQDTVQIITQSGLSQKWDQWSSWVLMLKRGILNDVKLVAKLDPDYINIQKLVPIIIGLFTCLFSCLICFCIEICYTRKPLIEERLKALT